MKKMLLVLAMLAGSVFIAASPASAHTQNMNVSAVCQADGTYDVTFTLNYASGAAPGKAFKRTGTTSFSNGWSPSTFNDWQAAGTLNSGSGSLTWHRTLPGTTTVAPWEYTYIEWNDKFVTKGDTRPEGLKGNCLPPDNTDHKIDICHLPPGNPANGQMIEVDFDSIINGTGHGNDGLDIIPPFNYMKQGVNGSFPGQNWTAAGQAQYNSGCGKPNQPGSNVETKDETGQPNCTTKTVTTTFYKRTTLYVFDESSWTWVRGTPGPWVVDHTTSRAATPEECPTTVTPVAPTVTDITKCGTDGLVVLPTTEGVTYAFDPAGASPTQGQWKVTASPQTGYVFAGDAVTSWSGNLGAHTECPVVVTPVAPSVTDIAKCGEDGLVVLPTTEGVTYAFDPAGDSPTEGSWKVTATAKEGFTFPADTQASWSGDLGDRIECVLPVPPKVADSCDEDGNVALPVTEGVTYAFTEGDGVTGEWTVTATPAPGFGFADGTVAEWSGTVTPPEECAGGTQTVVAEVVVVEICPGSDLPTPTEVDGVIYTFTIGDGVVGPWEITATAEEGYVLAGQSIFTGDAGDEGCVGGVSLEDDEVGDEVGDEDDDALLPDTGGVPLGLVLLGGLLTVAGVFLIRGHRSLD